MDTTVVQSLDSNPFYPKEDDDQVLSPDVPYLNTTNALMCLAQCTRLNITFSINLLARFSSKLTKQHYNCVKHIFYYLHGTIDLHLFCYNN